MNSIMIARPRRARGAIAVTIARQLGRHPPRNTPVIRRQTMSCRRAVGKRGRALREPEADERHEHDAALADAAREQRKHDEPDALADEVCRKDRTELGVAQAERARHVGRERPENRVDQAVEEVDQRADADQNQHRRRESPPTGDVSGTSASDIREFVADRYTRPVLSREDADRDRARLGASIDARPSTRKPRTGFTRCRTARAPPRRSRAPGRRSRRCRAAARTISLLSRATRAIGQVDAVLESDAHEVAAEREAERRDLEHVAPGAVTPQIAFGNSRRPSSIANSTLRAIGGVAPKPPPCSSQTLSRWRSNRPSFA